MSARKIKLISVKYKHNPKGSMLTVGPDISKEAADFLVKSEVASEVIESHVKKEANNA